MHIPERVTEVVEEEDYAPEKSYSERRRTENVGTRKIWSYPERKRTEDVGNPTNWRGIKPRWYTCDLQDHMARDCPQKRSDKSIQEVNFIFMNVSPDNKQNNLVYEAFGKGILD